jgi:hypothetical protein
MDAGAHRRRHTVYAATQNDPEDCMKASAVSLMTVGALAIALATVSSDASAYTRRICGLAGVFSNPSAISFGNCSASNGSGSNVIASYSIPIDNTNAITAKTWAISGLFNPNITNARLRTFQNTTTWSTGTLKTCSNCGLPEQYTLDCSGSGCSVPSGGSATVKVDVGAGQAVYDVEITQ